MTRNCFCARGSVSLLGQLYLVVRIFKTTIYAIFQKFLFMLALGGIYILWKKIFATTMECGMEKKQENIRIFSKKVLILWKSSAIIGQCMSKIRNRRCNNAQH